jgi:hypothetical protein
MLDLTDSDALYVVVREQMSRVTREMFPLVLAPLYDSGVLEITISNQEVSMRMPHVPQLGVYRMERKRTLH